MGKSNGARGAKGRGGRRRQRVPRPLSAGTVCVFKRTLNAGNITKAVADQGYSWVTQPGSLLDWSSLQAVWARYRLLRVTNHYIISGEFDATPAYPTFFVYHDMVSAGAPSSIQEAMLKQGVKQLNFGSMAPKRSFTFVPNVWTSTGTQTQVPAPSAYYQTATAFAPTFTSCAGWGLNYNSSTAAPNILLVQEMLIEFSQPA